MPVFWDDWADAWFMIIEVRIIIPKIAKVMMIAFFLISFLRLIIIFHVTQRSISYLLFVLHNIEKYLHNSHIFYWYCITASNIAMES